MDSLSQQPHSNHCRYHGHTWTIRKHIGNSKGFWEDLHLKKFRMALLAPVKMKEGFASVRTVRFISSLSLRTAFLWSKC